MGGGKHSPDGLSLLRWGEGRAMPWKNGGGITHEIAVRPPDAGFETFDWRLSMAEVASDGPFSAFPGIDRTLALMTGAGIRLCLADGGEIRVDAPGAPARFDGEMACEGRLIDGPILDLNVMTRRARMTHRLSLVTLDPAGPALTLPAGEAAADGEEGSPAATALICHSGVAMVGTGAEQLDLRPRDVLIRETGAGPHLRLEAGCGLPAVVYRVEILRR
ncbi:HutD family protein [Microvirga tunisiensis]|uniref:HutD family protein n=1 Tax=Pannonibacter tanglangensis TaxID=2750084 RepID=A0A7X5F0N8_9HYPH|nr:HutD family protein [Pannonibacter sp. XCT-53]NBN77617.1 HutD family protein [Pannonibacter sp. XCT-53]